MARAFVIRPFGEKPDSSGKKIDFEKVHRDLIGPALKAAEVAGGTTGEIIDSGNIREDMFSLILGADLVVCDLTIHNANVFYELGIRHALRKRRTLLIKGVPADGTPFDLLTDRYHSYDLENPASSLVELTEAIKATLASQRETDSPIFKMLPGLAEGDTSPAGVVPLDFREEVERAVAAKSKGWLRLLADDLQSLRFQWAGLRLVGEAQLKLKDFTGARDTFEAIRTIYPTDISANLALANVYERLYRNQLDPQLLTSSDQAIARVLDSEQTTLQNRVEALALKGRNLKTLWRRELKVPSNVEQRRKAAMNPFLRDSFKAYLKAFRQDLNHFWSGLAALQMGVIFLDLSQDEDGSWKNSFDDDNEAVEQRTLIAKEIGMLRAVVPASIDAALQQMAQNHPDFVWANVSKADLHFLGDGQTPDRVVRRYKDSIPSDNPFVCDAAKGQLELFECLGIKAELARKVIAEIDSSFKGGKAPEQPKHVILFAGHRIDIPGQGEVRFPEAAAKRAKEAVREAIAALQGDHELILFASAAPGADIVFHEACRELKLNSIICLPMPRVAYSRLCFENLDTWHSRYLELLATIPQSLELASADGLPRWLEGSGADPWERGNRWVLQMALAVEATRYTLLALWDGKETGIKPGGTAHMVQLARLAGNVQIKPIELQSLLPDAGQAALSPLAET